MRPAYRQARSVTPCARTAAAAGGFVQPLPSLFRFRSGRMIPWLPSSTTSFAPAAAAYPQTTAGRLRNSNVNLPHALEGLETRDQLAEVEGVRKEQIERDRGLLVSGIQVIVEVECFCVQAFDLGINNGK